MPHLESDIPTIVAHSLDASWAKVSPAFPAHWTMMVFHWRDESDVVRSRYFWRTYSHHRAVAIFLPWLHHMLKGFQVMTHGCRVPVWFAYSSAIQAMIWLLVLTSGAGTSLVGQTCGAMALMYALLSLSSSVIESCLGSTMIHHLPHHSGMPTVAHLKLIHADSDFTSSSDTSWWNLIPHLNGPLTLLCWDLRHIHLMSDQLSFSISSSTSTIFIGSSRISTRCSS